MRKRQGSRARRGDLTSLAALQLTAFGLGLRLLETSAHAAGVMARRGAMLAVAMAEPAKLADPEFVRMVAEKAEAAGESWLRAARHVGCCGPAGAVAMAASGLELAESCLAPYRRRVRANARRLGGRRGPRRRGR
ncbi:MAG TPA: hypothetical protein VFY87_02010 [Geminicoccaceae bacterium]|nr:hypothetical protein [Geminicoccaceae bacterium]